MSRLTAGDIIPTVAIQPSASPITLNVQPAPGNILGGNSLQQLAQALGVATSGVTALGQAVVNRQNRQAAEQGASIDFSEVIARGDNLNKSFKQIVTEMNLPDTANPYMLAAAERNFGSMVALKVRNGILSRMAELSDPSLDSNSQSNLLRQIIAEETERWGGNRLAGNFYANTAFGEQVNEFLPGIEQQIGNEFLKNKESQALLDLEAGFSEYFAVAAQDGADTDQFNKQFAARIIEMQRFTTDPTKVQAALYRSVVTAFQSATTQEQIDNIEDAALSIPYGQRGTVADNWGLRLQLLTAKQRAADDLDRKGDQEQKRFERAVDAGLRDIRAKGITSQTIERMQAGEDPVVALQSMMEGVRDQYPPEVFDMMYRDLLNEVGRAGGTYKSLTEPDNAEERKRIIGMITDGKITNLSVAIDLAKQGNVDIAAVTSFWESWYSGASETRGSSRLYAEAVQKDLSITAESLGVPIVNIELLNNLMTDASERFAQFVDGQTTHEGKTYTEWLREDGPKASRKAAEAVMSKIYIDLKQEYEQRFRSDSARRSGAVEGETGRSAAAREGAVVRTPAERTQYVRGLYSRVQQDYAPVYAAFTWQADDLLTFEFSNPSAVASRIATMLREDGPFEASLNLTPEYFRGVNGSNRRMVTFDGSTYTVSVVSNQLSPDGQPIIEEISRFTRDQLIGPAVQIKMSPLAGLSVDEVLNDTTGIPGISLSEFKRQNKSAENPWWLSVPVFGSKQELKDMLDGTGSYSDDQYEQFLRAVLGEDLRETTIATFRGAQARLLDDKERLQLLVPSKKGQQFFPRRNR